MAKAQVITNFSFNCSDTETLVNSYVDGELNEPLAGYFKEHLEACPECSKMAEEIDSLKSIASSLAETPIPEDVRGRFRENLRLALKL